MEIALFFGLMAVYVILSRMKFAQQMDQSFRERAERRREIRERHARWRRRREQRNAVESQDCCAESNCCA